MSCPPWRIPVHEPAPEDPARRLKLKRRSRALKLLALFLFTFATLSIPFFIELASNPAASALGLLFTLGSAKYLVSAVLFTLLVGLFLS